MEIQQLNKYISNLETSIVSTFIHYTVVLITLVKKSLFTTNVDGSHAAKESGRLIHVI